MKPAGFTGKGKGTSCVTLRKPLPDRRVTAGFPKMVSSPSLGLTAEQDCCSAIFYLYSYQAPIIKLMLLTT
jgi:hypothetical protein